MLIILINFDRINHVYTTSALQELTSNVIWCDFDPASSLICVLFARCCSILQTGHITLSSTPDQQLENHSTKYHRQQTLYNTLELLMMGVVVPETCWASNKICNKNLCCIYLAFYFHILIVTVCTSIPTLNIKEFYFQHRAFLSYTNPEKNYFTTDINKSVFIAEKKCVYCAVRYESLNK